MSNVEEDMKIFITVVLSALLLFGCKSGNSLSKQETIAAVTNKIESRNYKFVPNTAIPMSGRSIPLTYSYSLYVSKDTINAYLPYFGRAYIAPSPTEDGGIKFISTDFDYSAVDKDKGTWEITIRPKDNNRRYTMSLQIGDNGYATLNVQDTNRQSINFYGTIE
jgi:hypothetical protein